MNERIYSEIEALMKDEQFAAKLSAAEDLDEFAKIFTDAGYPVTAEELEAAYIKVGENGELSEEAMDSVAGGGILAGAAIVYVGYKLVRGYIDGARSGWKKYC